MCLSSDWSNGEEYSSIQRALLCNILTLLLIHSLQNIQKIGQYLNCDSISVYVLLKESNFAILERAFIFLLTLLHSFKTWLTYFKSLSTVIPRNLTSFLPDETLSYIYPYSMFITKTIKWNLSGFNFIKLLIL